MKKTRNVSIRTKMLAGIMAVLLASFCLLGFILLSRSTTALNDNWHTQIDSMAERYAAKNKVAFERFNTYTGALSKYFAILADNGFSSRDIVNETLSESIKGTNDFCYSIFTEWEPNAFDNSDMIYKSTDGTDSTGRLMYRYYKSGSDCVLMKYDGAQNDYGSDYEKVKSSMKRIITEPYYQQVDGKNVVFMTILAPIIVNEKFCGVVGVDISLNTLQTAFVQEMGTGITVEMLSYNGIKAVSGDSDNVMKAASLTDDLKKTMQAGESGTFEPNGKYIAVSGIALTDIDTPLSVGAMANTASSDAASLMIFGIILFVAAFIIIAVIVLLIANSILRPIKQMSAFAEKTADGQMDFQINNKYGNNEIGKFAQAFKRVQDSIVRMVADVQKTANDITIGDLTKRADLDQYPGDYKIIMSGLNSIMDSITVLVESTKESVQNVAGASQQISTGAQALAQGATEQASAVEELGVTIDEVAQRTSANAASTEKAKNLSDQISVVAADGNRKMNDLLNAIEEINDASESISKIIKTIEDIAFQTNILALNASVEAARAGSQGKGFAVVAAEVKNLASKSAEAAKETNMLINTSIEKTKAGVGIGNEMKDSLSTMIGGIGDIANAITQIASDTKLQAVGTEQIKTGMNQISTVVQNNAGTAEESAAASEELSAQASSLNSIIQKYKVASQESIPGNTKPFLLSEAKY
jgi:methyl-accepting chemotaxis protein